MQKKIRWKDVLQATNGGLMIVCCLLLVGCSDQELSLDDQITLLNLQTLPAVQHPPDNPTSEKKVELGRLLFYDPILSGQKDISCYTCHLPANAYAEPLDLSRGPGGSGVGHNRVGGVIAIRNSTGVVNSAFVGLRDANQIYDPLKAAMTWTINPRALEPQATAGALVNPTHMRGSGKYDGTTVGDTLAQRLRKIAAYVSLFDNAFNGTNTINKANIGNALGAFQRSLISKNSPYDRYLSGQRDALTEQQKRGLLLFYGKANCATCHGGPMFSDYSLYNLGVKHNPRLVNLDKGAGDKYMFRTPSLRNVTLTGPYMHNGVIATLREVIEFYDKGLSENPEIPQQDISIKIQPLHLTADEKDNLLAFLEALTDQSYDQRIPASVPSGLKVGGN